MKILFSPRNAERQSLCHQGLGTGCPKGMTCRPLSGEEEKKMSKKKKYFYLEF